MALKRRINDNHQSSHGWFWRWKFTFSFLLIYLLQFNSEQFRHKLTNHITGGNWLWSTSIIIISQHSRIMKPPPASDELVHSQTQGNMQNNIWNILVLLCLWITSGCNTIWRMLQLSRGSKQENKIQITLEPCGGMRIMSEFPWIMSMTLDWSVLPAWLPRSACGH